MGVPLETWRARIGTFPQGPRPKKSSAPMCVGRDVMAGLPRITLLKCEEEKGWRDKNETFPQRPRLKNSRAVLCECREFIAGLLGLTLLLSLCQLNVGNHSPTFDNELLCSAQTQPSGTRVCSIQTSNTQNYTTTLEFWDLAGDDSSKIGQKGYAMSRRLLMLSGDVELNPGPNKSPEEKEKTTDKAKLVSSTQVQGIPSTSQQAFVTEEQGSRGPLADKDDRLAKEASVKGGKRVASEDSGRQSREKGKKIDTEVTLAGTGQQASVVEEPGDQYPGPAMDDRQTKRAGRRRVPFEDDVEQSKPRRAAALMSEEDYNLLNSRLPQLIGNISIEDGMLLANLRSRGALTQQQEDYIKSKWDRINQVKCLIDVLLKRDSNTVDKFIYSLRATNQSYVADKWLRQPRQADDWGPIDTGSVGLGATNFLSDADVNLLERCRPKMMADIKLANGKLLAELRSRGVLTEIEEGYIKQITGASNAVGYVVDLLLRKDPISLEEFLHALNHSGHSFVVDYLRAPTTIDETPFVRGGVSTAELQEALKSNMQDRLDEWKTAIEEGVSSQEGLLPYINQPCIETKDLQRRSLNDTIELVEDSRPGDRIAIYGEAGMGKTTLLKQLTRSWIDKSNIKLVDKFTFVFLIPLRLIGKTFLLNIICEELELVPPSNLGNLKEALDRDERKTLFLLDSFEELRGDVVKAKHTAIDDLIKGRLFPKSTVVITSRPGSRLKPAKNQTTARLQDLPEHEVKEVIQLHSGESKYYAVDKVQRSFPALAFLQKPINLALFIFIITQNKHLTLPYTQAEVFSLMLQYNMLAFAKKKKLSEFTPQAGSYITNKTIPRDIRRLFRDIARKCYERRKKNNVALHIKDADDLHEYLNFGLFTAGPDTNTVLLPHRLFIEYFAAAHLAEHPETRNDLFEAIKETSERKSPRSPLSDVVRSMGLENILRFVIALSPQPQLDWVCRQVGSLFVVEREKIEDCDNYRLVNSEYYSELIRDCGDESGKRLLAAALLDAPVRDVIGWKEEDRSHVFLLYLDNEQRVTFLKKVNNIDLHVKDGESTLSGTPDNKSLGIGDRFVIELVYLSDCFIQADKLYVSGELGGCLDLPASMFTRVSGVHQLKLERCALHEILSGQRLSEKEARQLLRKRCPLAEIKLQQYGGARSEVEELLPDPEMQRLYEEACLSGVRTVRETRLMFIGRFEAGKTSLKRSLLSQDFEPEHKETHGLEGPDGSPDDAVVVDQETTCDWKPVSKNYKEDLIRELVEAIRSQKSGKEEATQHTTNVGHSQDSNQATNEQRVAERHDQDTTFNPPDLASGTRTETQQATNTRNMQKKLKPMGIEIKKQSDSYKDEEHMWLTLWDFGGQHVYYESHQAFLSNMVVYLLVTDITEHLDKNDAPKETNTPDSAIEFLEFWLNSVHTHLVQRQKHRDQGSEKNCIPPVIIVCTKTDKIGENAERRERKIREYTNKLKLLLLRKPYYDHVKGIIAVSNCLPDDSGITKLREKIVEVAPMLPYWNEPRPIKWLLLLLVLKEQAEQTQEPVITMSELHQKASEYNVPEKEVDAFLAFHHNLGDLIFFPDEDTRDTIILSPEWLASVFSNVITKDGSYLREGLQPAHLDDLDKGFFSKDTAKALVKGSKKMEGCPPERLIKIMEKFNILLSCKAESQVMNPTEKFLVPCLLKPFPNKKEVEESTAATKFHFKFVPKTVSEERDPCEWGFLPQGLFHRIVCRCSRIEGWACHVDTAWSDYVKFDMGKFVLSLYMVPNGITLFASNFSGQDTEYDHADALSEKREDVIKVINSVTKEVFPNLRYVSYLECDCATGKHGFIQVPQNTEMLQGRKPCPVHGEHVELEKWNVWLGKQAPAPGREHKIMTDKHKEGLRKHFEDLTSNLTADAMLDKLVAENIITMDEQEELLGEKGSRARAGHLVRLLSKREDKTYYVFIQALKKYSMPHLAKLLEDADKE